MPLLDNTFDLMAALFGKIKFAAATADENAVPVLGQRKKISGPSPFPRLGFAIECAHNGRDVWIMGGHDFTSSASATIKQSNSTMSTACISLSGLWSYAKHTITGTPPPARLYHTLTRMQDQNMQTKLIMFGGIGPNGKRLTDDEAVHIFDAETRAWSRPRIQGTVESRYGHAAIASSNRIYMFGGKSFGDYASGDGAGFLGDTIVLDFTAGVTRWQIASTGASATYPAPSARAYHSLSLYHTQFVLFGGECGYECMDDVWLFDPSKCTWKQMEIKGDLAPCARYHHGAVVYGDFLVIIGGSDFGGCALDDIWALDLKVGTWAFVGTLQNAKAEVRATIHKNTVIVFGSQGQGNTSSSPEDGVIELVDLTKVKLSKSAGNGSVRPPTPGDAPSSSSKLKISEPILLEKTSPPVPAHLLPPERQVVELPPAPPLPMSLEPIDDDLPPPPEPVEPALSPISPPPSRKASISKPDTASSGNNDEEIKKLQTEVNWLKAQLEATRTHSKSTASSSSSVSTKLENVINQFSSQKDTAERTALFKSLVQMRSELADLEAQLQGQEKLKAELAQMKNANVSLEKLSIEESTLSNLMSACSDAMARIGASSSLSHDASAQDVAENLISVIQTLSYTQKESASLISNQAAQINTLQQAVEKHRDLATQLASEIEILKVASPASPSFDEQIVKTLELKVASLSKAKAELEARFKSVDDKATSAEHLAQSRSIEISQLKDKLAQSEGDCARLIKQSKQLESQLSSNADSSASAEAMSKKVDALEQQLAAKSKEIGVLKSSCEAVSKEATGSKKLVASLESEKSALTASLIAAKDQVQQLEKQVELSKGSASAEVNGLRAQLKTAEQQRGLLSDELAKTKKSLKQAEAQSTRQNEFNSTVQQTKAELEEAQRQRLQLESEVKQLNVQIKSRDKDLSDLRSRLFKAESQAETYKYDLDIARSQPHDSIPLPPPLPVSLGDIPIAPPAPIAGSIPVAPPAPPAPPANMSTIPPPPPVPTSTPATNSVSPIASKAPDLLAEIRAGKQLKKAARVSSGKSGASSSAAIGGNAGTSSRPKPMDPMAMMMAEMSKKKLKSRK